MLPVNGHPLFKNNTFQLMAINKAGFLNISHRFEDDPAFGEIMRRFCIGSVTDNDLLELNKRHISHDNVILPPIKDIRCACYKNDERNAYNDVVFLHHLKYTHEMANSDSMSSPKHTCIIKASMRDGTSNKKLAHQCTT